MWSPCRRATVTTGRAARALAVGDALRFGESLAASRVAQWQSRPGRAIIVEPEEEHAYALALEDGRALEAAWSDLAQQPRFGRKRRRPGSCMPMPAPAHAAQGRTYVRGGDVCRGGHGRAGDLCWPDPAPARGQVMYSSATGSTPCAGKRQEDARMPASDAMVAGTPVPRGADLQ